MVPNVRWLLYLDYWTGSVAPLLVNIFNSWLIWDYFFKGWWHLVSFIDHYTHFIYKIVRHQLSYMQLYNTQHAYNSSRIIIFSVFQKIQSDTPDSFLECTSLFWSFLTLKVCHMFCFLLVQILFPKKTFCAKWWIKQTFASQKVRFSWTNDD